MAKITINTHKDNAYVLSDIQNTFGGFEVVGDFKTWKDNGSNKRYPDLIEIRLVNIEKTKHLNVTKANYCKNNQKFEIHVETVDPRFRNYRLDYTSALSEKLLFPNDVSNQIEVVIWIYNSVPEKPEKVYQICGETSKEDLKFPRKKKAFIGFNPERKAGNILVGG